MFGAVAETPQRETTLFHPRGRYGVAKVYGRFITRNYRGSFGMCGVSGILFNHKSPQRGLGFVTRKITHGVVSIKLGRFLLSGTCEQQSTFRWTARWDKAFGE